MKRFFNGVAFLTPEAAREFESKSWVVASFRSLLEDPWALGELCRRGRLP